MSMVAKFFFFFFGSSSTDNPFFFFLLPAIFFFFLLLMDLVWNVCRCFFLFVFGYGLCSDYMLNLGIDLGMGCISRKISFDI